MEKLALALLFVAWRNNYQCNLNPHRWACAETQSLYYMPTEQNPRSAMQSLTKVITAFLMPAALWLVPQVSFAQPQDYNVLQECMKLSSDDVDINNCIDNYLDLMDDNIQDITEYIARDLDDASLNQFQLSQQAFFDYRKQNCLWYLEFSSPQAVAEKIAKNCLAKMSQYRLAELQSLIATDQGKANTLRGFYVYGASRNSFQPCGSDQRYWVVGDNEQVGQLQQDYLNQSTASLQVLYAELRGSIVPNQDYPEHSGEVRLTAVTMLSPPSDSQCRLPKGATANTLATLPEVKPAAVPEPEPVVQTPDEPEQLLRAYFGEWLAECKQNKSSFTCELAVSFTGDGVTDENRPELRMSRRASKRTLLYMKFPDREVDSPAKIRWRVDNFAFGDIVGSEIRVDEAGTQQLVHEKKFLRDDLMPLFIKGTELGVEVLVDVDDDRGERFEASLKGLTRALNFADDFIASGGKL